MWPSPWLGRQANGSLDFEISGCKWLWLVGLRVHGKSGYSFVRRGSLE